MQVCQLEFSKSVSCLGIRKCTQIWCTHCYTLIIFSESILLFINWHLYRTWPSHLKNGSLKNVVRQKDILMSVNIANCTNEIFFIKFKIIFQFLGVVYSETVGNPPSFQLNYTTFKHVQSYAITAKLMIGGIITSEKGTVEYTILDQISSRIYKPTTCPTTSSRRRRKRMIDINQWVTSWVCL